MFKCLRNNIPCIPDWWISWVLNHARSLLVVILSITSILLFFTIQNFKINTDLTEMISNDLPFRRVVKKFHADFPDLVGAIVVVVEGDAPEQVNQARHILADRLRRETGLFKSIYTPGGGPFFEKNGLLYLSESELEQQGDALSEMQPFLALLSRDFSLSGLFSVLTQIVEQQDISLADNEKIIRLFDKLGQAFTYAGQGKKQHMSWQDLMLDNSKLSRKTQLILLQPILNYQKINPAKQAVNLIRKATEELHLNEQYDVLVNITGKPVINYEDLRSVRKDITTASLISFVLVGVILYLGLGSFRLVFAGLATLLTGLAWTIAFAILLVGRLNMISVTFVVLFIGLGIDYSIQISLRYKELLFLGRPHKKAIAEAVSATGNTLLLCAVSTAIGFYAFVPTAYVGASELGLISGTGMLFIFLASITILPALMILMPEKKNRLLPLPIGKSIALLLIKYPRHIVTAATILFLVSIALLPRVSFDANPFNMSDQRSESVRTAMRLFQGEHSPWTISVLASDRQEAIRQAARLKQLPEVKSVITIDSFIPKNQEEKLEQIEDMALSMPPLPEQQKKRPADWYQRDKKALADLSRALDKKINADNVEGAELSAMGNLAGEIHHFQKLLTGPDQGTVLFDRLDSALLPDLEILLHRLHTLMEAAPIDLSQLPKDLISRYVSKNNQYRIQVFPQRDLRDINNLNNFVTAVTSIAPQATDQPVTVLAAGKTIVSAFRTASILAFILIALFLWIVMKTWKAALLVLLPLLLALCYTMAAAVLVDIPFNFANIIIVPLLLGIGVDSSIHVIHRIRELREINIHILETSTARAVLFSSLTTILSFGTLSFMHHAGTAGMGKLLTLSVILMILCTLIILPAYLELHIPRRKH
jgi:hopanoid biosynthesis associated RND transporter like protein HpnN